MSSGMRISGCRYFSLLFFDHFLKEIMIVMLLLLYFVDFADTIEFMVSFLKIGVNSDHKIIKKLIIDGIVYF